MCRNNLRIAVPICLAVVFAVAWNAGAGDVNPPPGPVLPTMLRLDEIEPRTPISSLPFTINACGSYFLTGCLTGSAGQNGITIQADDVTLDLNGFSLIGVPGSLNGIDIPSPQVNIKIFGGTVENWDFDGINALNAGNSQYFDLHLSDNGGAGLSAGQGSSITGCTASSNALVGIGASDGCTVTRCTAYENVGNGIAVISECYVYRNTSSANGAGGDGAGIHLLGGENRIEANNVTNNDRGIDADAAGNLIIKNSARGNTTDYDLIAGTAFGPIVDLGAGGDLALIPNADHPWANFSFSCTPSPEVCDGLDNDCDGVADNGNPGGGGACATGQLGVCAAGTEQCQGGAIVCIQNQLPSPELCDGQDNDCNGAIDDNPIDIGGQCQTGMQGVCDPGTEQCIAGSIVCVPDVPASPEVCDLLDNDCNGVVDDNPVGAGGACNTGLPGVCAAGTVVCQGGALNCQQDVPPSAEICDGLDNDCNGQVDDGIGCGNLGDPCIMPGNCLSSFCTDGVCCDSNCTGTCQHCALFGPPGICHDISAGNDPDGECSFPFTDCDGNGECQ